MGDLRFEGRLSGFPAEAADKWAVGARQTTQPAGDAVSVTVVWIGERLERLGGYGLEQTETDERRRHSQVDVGVGGEWAKSMRGRVSAWTWPSRERQLELRVSTLRVPSGGSPTPKSLSCLP